MHRKAFRRRALRIGLVTFNLALLGGVAAVLIMNPTQADSATRAAVQPTEDTSTTSAASPLDQLSSANIALTVARMGNLPETTAITNQADSESIQLDQVSTSNLTMTTKPQVVNSTFKSAQDIKSYVTVEGDTISSIASKFGITSDSIRWSNGITGNSIAAGKTLVIPPVSGIVYTVASGDTVDSLASKFNADKAKIIAFNDAYAEVGGLKVGQRIIIPGGSKVAATRSTVPLFSRSWGGTVSYDGNGYSPGYCTWWVAKRRIQVGNPVPNNMGDAYTWDDYYMIHGLPWGYTPKVGAAVVTKTSSRPGHVAFVENVNADGSIVVSEMNYNWVRYSLRNRTIDADTASHYRYLY